MRYVFDAETTTKEQGHPFDLDNKMCNIGFRNIDTNEVKIFKIEWDDEPYGDSLREIQKILDSTTLLIGFNEKFDLHWLRRYNLDINIRTRIFDCQLAYFILTHQKNAYPSLDGVAEHYGVEKKLDVVKTEYWERGLDTDQVPYEVLTEYLAQDLNVTQQIYEALQKDIQNISPEMQKLISVGMQDLQVLEDIEWSGLLYNKDKSIILGDKLEDEIEGINKELQDIFGGSFININSGDHLSACLYGGTIWLDDRETYIFTYKDGRTTEKTRPIKTPVHFKGLFKPLEGTALKKEGYYSTDEATLKTLAEKAKGLEEFVLESLLRRTKLEKRRSTYFHGLPKRIEKMNWKDNIIHSNLNQCVAETGRLSSTKPNVQNVDGEVKEVFPSRFKIKRKYHDD